MKKITADSLYELKNVGQPKQASRHVFFTQTQMNRQKNRYDTSIWSVNLDTQQLSEWGDSGSYNSRIDLSKDQQWLSFISNDHPSEQLQLKVQSLQGGKAITLTAEEEGVTHYFWSQDGKNLYYQTNRPNEKTRTDAERQLPQPTVITKTTYQLDGSGIVPPVTGVQLKKVNLQTRELTTLAESDKEIQWHYVSKDESYAIYSKDSSSEDDWRYGQSQLYRYDFSTKVETCLTPNEPRGSFYFKGVTPDEKYFILVGHLFEYAFVSQHHLYRYSVEEQSLVNLTKELDIEVGDLLVADFQQEVYGVEMTWIDEETFAFISTEAGRTCLYSMKLDGSYDVLFQLPAHLTGACILSKDTWVMTYSTMSLPSSLAVYHIATQQIEEVYQPNERFLNEYTFTTPERFYYQGYDQWNIQGWYLPPVKELDGCVSEDSKHPAILYIHGGPQVAYGETFFHEMQVFSALGYGVILINPRGSNSYGQAFVASILGDYGNHDFDDLMLGVDEVLQKHPEIDPNALFVAGGSYGGFMTNWIVTHTNRFKAAVTQRSISNWISFYGTSDIGPFFVEYQLQADILNPKRLWEMSPIAYIQNAQTPLLILHGEEDLRCPKEQAEQFYIAMKKRKIPTKLILFPHSSHGLSRTGLPNLRQERLNAIIEWFNHYQNKIEEEEKRT